MKLYGLIGYPLSHSWSAQYFSEKFSLESRQEEIYRLFPIKDILELPGLLSSNPDLCGLNVTIPYKEKVINLLDELDDQAYQIGAVNTIKISRQNGRIMTRGYNTDSDGFIKSLPSGFNHKNALILGTGGASKAIVYALRKLGINYSLVSRNPFNDHILAYQDINKSILEQHSLIINTTPLGMFPKVNKYPLIPYAWLTTEHYLYDLVYNPSETMFLRQGKAKGTMLQNGLEMLKKQADLSYEIFQ